VSAFVFGKMPAHGDFVARGLSPSERTQWDDWLTQEMQGAQAAYGDAFADLYASAPVWRFAGSGRAGVLACSIDAVGRRFPLVVGCTAPAASVALAEACEDQLYNGFEQGWTVDGLIERLAAIDPPEAEAADRDIWWTPGNESFAADELPGQWPRTLLVRMLTSSGAMM
jgi:type VI secretion system ImpM family protein